MDGNDMISGAECALYATTLAQLHRLFAVELPQPLLVHLYHLPCQHQVNAAVDNAGANIINGGLGNDTLMGGLGNDFFLYNTLANSMTNFDTITDFSIAADSIQLDNAVFTALSAAGALAYTMFKNLTTGGAVDASDRILYNDAIGALFYDSDGTGASAAIQFTTLTATPTVFFDNFAVV